MYWWKVLEVPYDSNLKTIKKAYAKLLKVYNPEDDAEGYQRLREAYDQAIKYTKSKNGSENIQSYTNNNSTYNINYEEISNENEIEREDRNISENKKNKFKAHLNIDQVYYEKQDNSIDLNEQVNQFLKRLEVIYNDRSLREDPKVWQDLLNMNAIWNVYSFPIIEDEIFKFLINHNNLPHNIWTKLNDNFNWTKNERMLCEKYSTDTVDEFLKHLKNSSQHNSQKKVFEIKPNSQKTKFSGSNERLIKIIVALFLFVIMPLSVHYDKSQNRGKLDTAESIKAYEYKNNSEDDKKFITIIPRGESPTYLTNVRIYLKAVKPIDYFKLSESINNKIILSKEEINDNNLQDKIESQLFIGEFYNKVVIFADNNYTDESLDKNNVYEIEGAMCEINSEVFDDIQLYYLFKILKKDKYYWQYGTYIDCSPKEIERVGKNTEIMEMHGSKKVKVVKTLQEFQESRHGGLHSIYLKNIRPFDCYINKLDANNFLTKEELNKNNDSDKTYNQAFVGEFDGKNVMVIDRNFTMDKIDSDKGCTIYGYKDKLYKSDMMIDSINIEQYYLFDSY